MPGTHDARRRLLDATMDLLREGGMAAATPAAVAERAGAGKMSIYRHFEDKDALVAAALEDRDAAHREFLLRSTATDPRERVLGLFDSAAARADAPGFSGCAWVGCRLGVDGDGHPVAAAAAGHKDRMAADIAVLLREAGVPDAEEAAATVLTLYDGALVHAVIAGDGEPLRRARRAADRLL